LSLACDPVPTSQAPRDVSITSSPGTILIRGTCAFRGSPRTVDPELLRRIFALADVRTVEVDPGARTVLIRLCTGAHAGEVLRSIAAALRVEDGAARVTLPAIPAGRNRFWRHAGAVSTWEVVRVLPGRLRVRHDRLRGDPDLGLRIERIVGGLDGVNDVRSRALTGSLLVEYDARLQSAERLLHLLDEALIQIEAGAEPSMVTPIGFGMANMSLGLAAAGEFVLPALLPASALLLVGNNIGTLRDSWSQLRRFELGLPVLGSAIVVGTLVTGQYVAAALMGWMIKYWQGQDRARWLAARRGLLRDCREGVNAGGDPSSWTAAIEQAIAPRAAGFAPGEAFATGAVRPTLAAAALALVTGDAVAAAAILRPDYRTGVGAAESLEWLRALGACARRGILLRDSRALARLAEVDVLALDAPLDDPAVLAALRDGCALDIEILSPASRDDLDRAELLQAIRARGGKAAWLGDPITSGRAATEAHIAIARAPGLETAPDRASVILVEPSFRALVDLWEAVGDYKLRLKAAQRLTLVPNLLSVGGAFLLGFNSLAAVIISNFGTAGVFWRTSLRRPLGRQASSPRSASTDGQSGGAPSAASLQELPRELGALLVTVGVAGVILPGVMGAPALVAGGLILWPQAFGRVDRWFRRINPALHRRGMEQVGRYLCDLDRRYPIAPNPAQPASCR
jgi:hypothetical protein